MSKTGDQVINKMNEDEDKKKFANIIKVMTSQTSTETIFTELGGIAYIEIEVFDKETKKPFIRTYKTTPAGDIIEERD